MEHFVATRGGMLKKDAAADFKVVKYESHKAKPKAALVQNDISSGLTSNGPVDKRKGIDIQRARREIIKFGITGFSRTQQQEAKVALAVSLGARPPKAACKNYKLLMAERARQKALDKKYRDLQQAGKNPVGVSTAKKKFVFNKAIRPQYDSSKKKGKGDLLQIYGKATIDTAPSKPQKNIKKNNNNHKRKK